MLPCAHFNETSAPHVIYDHSIAQVF